MMNKYYYRLLILLSFTLSLYAQEKDSKYANQGRASLFDSTKSNYKPDILVGNPTNKDVEMAMDDMKAPYYRYEVVPTKLWFDFKKNLNKNTGLQLSISYASIFMGIAMLILVI